MVVFDENKLMDVKIDKLTSAIRKLSTQHKVSIPFRPRVYQDKG